MCRSKSYFLSFFAMLGVLVFSARSARGQDSIDNTNPYNQIYNQSNPLSPNGNNTQNPQSLDQQGTRPLPQYSTPQNNDLRNGEENTRNRTNSRATDENNLRLFNRLPPDPPTEFQKMVASSAGKLLPIYGAQLFRNSPTTFAPLDRVPVTPDYLIGPGDELLIQVWGQVTLNSRFLVDRSGNVYIPQVGTVSVAGQQFGHLQEYLKSQMGRVFRNFDLTVNMGELRSIQVFVVGQARRPGTYTVSSLSTLVNALFVTGGPSPQGSLRHIQLKRSGKVVADFDLYDLLLHGDKSHDLQLLPGDVIYIPSVGPQVAVAGSVNTPAIYELRSATGSTIDDLLEFAGGATNIASTEHVRLERVSAHSMRSVIDLSLNVTGRAQLLQDGDILELVAIVDRFKDGVTLRGNVANPGHYSWRSGMHVGDLFPDKDALITRDYWLKRGKLGEPILTYLPNCDPNTDPNQGRRLNSEINPETGLRYNYNGPGTDNEIGADGSTGLGVAPGRYVENESDYKEGCIPVPVNQANTYNAYNTPNVRNNTDQSGRNSAAIVNSPNDRSAQIGSGLQGQRDIRQDGQGTASGSAAEALLGKAPGHFEPRNDVTLSAPDINWSYAVIERQDKETLTTSLISFNLGHLVLDHDNSQNLALEPGDVVTIFSKADMQVPQVEQTRFVRLEGEFVSSGVYSVRPGETLKHLVERAGGITPDAYLYGSQFTRESTRRVQQQRLNEYVDQISLQSATRSVTSAGRSISALDSAAAEAAAAQSQNLIYSLRQARATGRIVLDLHPDSHSVDQLASIPLEDGDRFVVPHIPVTVGVAGAVYNPNAFLFDGQRRLRDYLRQAGGANRDGDRKRAYVIRADGSVISKQEISKWHQDAFDSMRIYPGDTIVIPLNLNKGATMRNVVDLSQIVGQFGIAIAATSLVF